MSIKWKVNVTACWAGNLKTEEVKYGSLKEFEGEYFGEEVGTWYSFIVRGDVLVMRLGNWGKLN
jgi:hypothetical protein